MAQALTPTSRLRAAPHPITIVAWDALPLARYAWGSAEGAARVARRFCLPDLARNGGDFARLGRRFGRQGVVFTPGYLERGRSGRSRDHRRRAGEACVQSGLDVAALHAERRGMVGASFGGMLATSAAAVRPGLLGGALNEVALDRSERGRDHPAPSRGDAGDWKSGGRSRLSAWPLARSRHQGCRRLAGVCPPHLHARRPRKVAIAQRSTLCTAAGWRGARFPAVVPRVAIPAGARRARRIERAPAAGDTRTNGPDVPGAKVFEVPGAGRPPTLFEPAVSAAFDEFLTAIG